MRIIIKYFQNQTLYLKRFQSTIKTQEKKSEIYSELKVRMLLTVYFGEISLFLRFFLLALDQWIKFIFAEDIYYFVEETALFLTNVQE